MYLDPDFRRDVPKDCKRYCVRCQKPIKLDANAIRVSINWDTMQTEQNEQREFEMEPNCWKVINKQTINQAREYGNVHRTKSKT